MTQQGQTLIQAWDSRSDSLDGRRRSVWLRWVAYTTVGYVLRGSMMTAAPVRTPRDLAVAPVVGALGFAVVGLLQWLVLRPNLDRVRGWAWVGATVLGQIAGMLAITLLVAGPLFLGTLTPIVKYIDPSALQFVTKLITGGLLGTVVGFAQWLILRRHLSAATWWIPASFLAGAAVALVTPATGLGLSFGVLSLVTGQFMSGMIVGVITGTTLVWLLRKSQKARSHLSAADSVNQ